MIYIAIITVLVGFFVVQKINAQKLKNNRMDIADFKEAISHKNIQLVDVRTPSEYKSGHIKGAKNIDVFSSQFKEKIKLLDKSKPTYLYCRSGKRSQTALKTMLNQGFENIYDLKGGYMTWEANK